MKTARTLSLEVLNHIRNAGFTAYIAGGAVRDHVLQRTPKDYDIATNALPDQVEALFAKTVAVGKAFGVIIVVLDGEEIEVATFREDVGYQDGRRPDSITFCGAKEDAKRRDFTINGMFLDPATDELIDYVGGQEDLKKGIIRAIGDPDRRFAEDHLRMLRAVRFAHTLGFEIEPATRQAIKNHADDLANISIERIENEFSRTLTESKRPGDALEELVELGLMRHIMPEILPMMGQVQPPEFHPEGDVFEHTVLMLNLMHCADQSREFNRLLAYSVLLHDIGKPATAFMGEDRIRFHGHERKSAEMSEVILRHLRVPKKEAKDIVIAVDGHMRFKDVQKMNKSTLRKLLGAETFDLELELHRIDCSGSHGLLDNYHFLVKKQAETVDEPALPDLWIRGSDLIALGVQPGPAMGIVLKHAYNDQLEGSVATREDLLAQIKGQL